MEQWICTECDEVSDSKGEEGCSHCGGELKPATGSPEHIDALIEEAAQDEIRVVQDEFKAKLLEEYSFYLKCPICKNVYDPGDYSEGGECPTLDGGRLKKITQRGFCVHGQH